MIINKTFENNDEKIIVAWVFKKMARQGYWGRRLIIDDHLFKNRKFKTDKKLNVKNVLKELVRIGVVLAHHSNVGGKRYSLNPEFKGEILCFIEK
ncbi:MAG: hypothetical protein J7K00_02835 [Candidatus Diapherotrites archaeon]|nr:hypothetical protein [Candidatus Diapherotrites archaeon]